MSHKDEFHARAIEARRQAGLTELANVRETLLRSAEAWEQMARREERVVAARDARAREKLASEGAVPSAVAGVIEPANQMDAT